MSNDDGLLRNVTREVLAELLPGLLEEALATPAPNGNGGGHRAQSPATPLAEDDAAVPQVPAPPIAKVHRPSGWSPASTPGDPSEHVASDPRPQVAVRNDADLDAFVRMLVRRLENPRDRLAILSGKLRFTLAAAAPAGSAPTAAAMRIEKGAVTERTVQEAARTGVGLVLSPRAVLTPMARDRARSLGVEIHKERPC